MIQLRPTFSESWYRVATLRAKLRASAQISRQFYRGERWYVVRDPAGNQFHRLSDAAYRFIGLLNGRRTVAEAWDICGGQLADDAPTQPEIIQILSHLYSANLIDADVTPDATVLLRRHKQLNKRKMQNRLMNVLFPRIPLWDPDQFLVRWLPVVRNFFSKIGAILWLVVIIASIATLTPHWTELKHAASNAISPGNWLYLWAVFVLIKLIHELGHAFACRRFGGECHELGIMFLVFIPTPYVDASTAWGFPNKWHRMFVGAAGMIVELFFAAICAFIWVSIGDKTSLQAVLAYNAMLVASVSTIIFNANPLLRYDGYYILSDLLEIPNLRQKSSEYAMGLIKRHVFRVKATQPLPPLVQRGWLFSYAVSSSIYRVFVGFVIILVVAYKIPVLGMLMAIGGVVTWLVVPVVKLSKYLLIEPELHRKRGRAALFCGAVAAVVLVLVGLIPFAVYVEPVGIVEASNREVIHNRAPGFVDEIKAVDGQLLHKGDVILVLKDKQLEAQIESLQAQIRGLRARIQQASVLDQAQKGIDQAQLVNVNSQLQTMMTRQADLQVKSPIDGTLVAPTLHEFSSRFVPRGTELATVATINQLVVKTALEQKDAELVRQESDKLYDVPADDTNTIQVRMAGDVQTVLYSHRAELLGAAQESLPSPALGQAGGSEIAVDPSDPKGMKPLNQQFELRIRLENTDGKYYPGQRAHVRLKLENKPLIWQWGRKFLQLLQTHEKDSKLT